LWLDEIDAICKNLEVEEAARFPESSRKKYKLSNAERRLRPSESPQVESIYNEKHTAIIGYKWRVDFVGAGVAKYEPKVEEKVGQGVMFETHKSKQRYF
jgi:hypothetical protein